MSQPQPDDSRPRILRAASDRAELEALKRSDAVSEVIDHYESLVDELGELQEPAISHAPADEQRRYFAAFRAEHHSSNGAADAGVWVHFPWNKRLIHFLDEPEWDLLRTSRNRNIINRDEQKALRETSVAVCGLSVGHSVATSIAWIGAAKRLKLADPDILSGANLNRIRSGIAAIGQPKTTIIARQIYELDPFADLHLYPDGVAAENVGRILDDDPRPQIVVDEMDNFRAKVMLREEARRRRLPVVMAFDIPQGTLVDVERFDVDPDLPLFHGLLGDLSMSDLPPTMPIQEMAKFVMRLYPPKYITPRMMESIGLFGKEIVSAPQLAISAFFAGAAVARAVMAIALDQPIARRGYMSWDEALSPKCDELAEAEDVRVRV